MSSDSKTNADARLDNVVSLSRHEFVTDIEKKLTEARRLFSLREYQSCEQILVQVLAAEPNNPKAKALSDLVSVKLSHSKLYNKLIDAPVSRLPLPPKAPTGTRSNLEELLRQETPVRRDAYRRRGRPPVGNPSIDTIRERTISAMVELLKETGKSSEQAQGVSRPETEFPVADPENAADPASSTAESAEVQTSNISNEAPLPTSPEPALSLGLSAADSGLLPLSLDELFLPPLARTKDSLAVQGPPEPRKAKSLTSSVLPKPGEPQFTNAQESAAALSFSEQSTLVDPATPHAEDPPAEPPVRVTPEPVGSDDSSAHPQSQSPSSKVIRLPDFRLFEQVTEPRRTTHQTDSTGRMEGHDDTEKEEVKASSMSLIKQYLHREQYELCAQELERMRVSFPDSKEVQGFVRNTYSRLAKLRGAKSFERQAKEYMESALAFYQQGKLPKALGLVREILKTNPDHPQAREFVMFVESRQTKARGKSQSSAPSRYCHACGTKVDEVSQFCFRCGKRLS